jgi:hypothetical protein
MPDDPKHGAKERRRQYRELAGLAHQRELEQALDSLEANFKAWRAGEIGPFELSDRIHEFHNGPAQELWKRYTGLDAGLNANMAFARGVLEDKDIPPDLLDEVRDAASGLRWLES